jgi:hypothetical protein
MCSMKARRRIVAYAALTLVIVCARPLFGQDVALRYVWKKGETLRYRVTQQAAVSMTGIPGMGEMTVNTTIVQGLKMAADDVAADGTATVRTTFESMKFEMGLPTGNVVYDSAAPSKQAADPITDALGKSLGLLIGESITVVTAPNGSVKSVEGLTRIGEKLKSAMPAGMSGGMGGLDTMFSDESMKSMFQQNFATLPDRAVKAGDTWKAEFTMNAPPAGTMATSTAYTLKAVDSVGGTQVARIAIAMTIKPTGGPVATDAGIPMTIKLGDASGEGEMAMDVKLGRLQKTVVRTTQPMTMSMQTPDGTALNMQALTKTTTTVELIEK